MPNYIKDPNDSNKQIPGPQPDNYYTRTSTPSTGSLVKTPNHILIGKNITNNVGFYFGTSASFAALGSATGSAVHYDNFGAPTAGTKLDIHPIAWSGSAADNAAGNVIFVYKGGLDGSGRG